MPWPTGCGCFHPPRLAGCHAWPISQSGRRLVKRRSGAYAVNRRAAIESIIEADPIATCLRTIMADRTMWMGSASDLMRLYAQSARDDISAGGAGIKNPRALAGRLRRAQTFLRSLGIEITFSREGRTGTRMIKVSTKAENCVSTVSIVGACRSNGGHGDLHGVSRVLE